MQLTEMERNINVSNINSRNIEAQLPIEAALQKKNEDSR
jgi:hypothetical protein